MAEPVSLTNLVASSELSQLACKQGLLVSGLDVVSPHVRRRAQTTRIYLGVLGKLSFLCSRFFFFFFTVCTFQRVSLWLLPGSLLLLRVSSVSANISTGKTW